MKFFWDREETGGKQNFDWEKPLSGNLGISGELRDEFKEIANRHHVTELEVVKQIMKLGIYLISERDKGRARFFIEDAKGEREILVFGDERPMEDN